jgi:hypothetical protein
MRHRLRNTAKNYSRKLYSGKQNERWEKGGRERDWAGIRKLSRENVMEWKGMFCNKESSRELLRKINRRGRKEAWEE